MGKQHFCKSLLSLYSEIVHSVLRLQHVSLSPLLAAPLQGYLSLTAGFVLFCFFFIPLFFSPCEILTYWFQRKASVTFSVELE